VREIMQQHGGTVTLDSVKGDGTTATAWFPRERGTTSAEAANIEQHRVPR
jgi:signal transduction histidine kinase